MKNIVPANRFSFLGFSMKKKHFYNLSLNINASESGKIIDEFNISHNSLTNTDKFGFLLNFADFRVFLIEVFRFKME